MTSVRGANFAFVIPCYNEAQNLPALLPLLDQTRVGGRAATRFVIVSDTSADGTDENVREFARKSSTPVSLIANPKRFGKSAAINQALAELPDVDLVVLISGDVLPERDCVCLLLKAFDDPRVGVAGGRPVPVGPRKNLATEITRLMWAMHHRIALKYPKTTELTVFRNVIKQIESDSLVDEAELEISISRQGYTIRYLPEARILSPTPVRLTDYIRQRATVTLGYMRLKRQRGHIMGTSQLGERLRALLAVQKQFPYRSVVAAIIVEALVRLFAWLEMLSGIDRGGLWRRSESTKRALVTDNVDPVVEIFT